MVRESKRKRNRSLLRPDTSSGQGFDHGPPLGSPRQALVEGEEGSLEDLLHVNSLIRKTGRHACVDR